MTQLPGFDDGKERDYYLEALAILARETMLMPQREHLEALNQYAMQLKGDNFDLRQILREKNIGVGKPLKDITGSDIDAALRLQNDRGVFDR